MTSYPGTPTDPTAFGQPFGPGVIAHLGGTADGTIYRCAGRVIPVRGLDRVMPVMGVRLFYGRRHDGAIVEYVLTGRAFRGAEIVARGECDLLWEPGAFCGKTWEVYGELAEVTIHHDLSPAATTELGYRWARALGAA